MKLTVFERLLLRNIIPEIERWNFDSMKAARILLENLFTEEEGAKLQIHQVEGEEPGKSQLTWRNQDDEGNPIPQEKEVRVSDGLKKKIADFLEGLDMQDKLNWSHYTLCEKFGVKSESKEKGK